MLITSYLTLPVVPKTLPSCEKSIALISLWASLMVLKIFHDSKSQHVMVPSAPDIQVITYSYKLYVIGLLIELELTIKNLMQITKLTY